MPLSGLQHPASYRGKSSLCVLRACHVPGTMPSTLCGSPHLVFTITLSDEIFYVYCIWTKLSTENWVAFSTSIPMKQGIGELSWERSVWVSVSHTCFGRFFFFFFFAVCLFFGHATWLARSYVPDQGLNLDPQQLACGVLTTGPPGNSLSLILWAGTAACSRRPPYHKALHIWHLVITVCLSPVEPQKRTWLGFWVRDLHLFGENA